MNDQPIIIEKTFPSPVAEIWKALTIETEMKKWYFDLPGFKAEPGYKFQFTGGPSPEKQYLHLCEVKEVVPEKKLSYSWRYDGYPGNSLVTFELTSLGNQTKLMLTHSGIESFGAENPDLARENFVIGWTHIVNISLKEYLETSVKK